MFRSAELLVLDDEAVAQSLGGGLHSLDTGGGHHGADCPPSGGAAEIPYFFFRFGRAAAALNVPDLMHVVELGEKGGRQRYEPMNPPAALQGLENDTAGSVVDVTMRDGQPLANPAAGIVEQQGEGALFPVVRFGRGPVDGGEEAPPLVGG